MPKRIKIKLPTIEFQFDDNGVKVWGNEDDGWFDLCSRHLLDDEPLLRKAIEKHHEFSGWYPEGFEYCDCGFVHHYEDKCPLGERTKMYDEWRIIIDEE